MEDILMWSGREFTVLWQGELREGNFDVEGVIVMRGWNMN